MKLLSFAPCIITMALLMFAPMPVFSASLINKSDTLTRLKAQEFANHTIQFTSNSGMNDGTMNIFFGDAVSSMSAIDYTDIDLLYGPIGTEIQRVLYLQPGTNVWGVSINEQEKKLILTYPITNGFPILSNDRVIIKIGTHATNDLPSTKTIFRQLKNGNPISMGHIVRIQTQYDSGSLAIPIVWEDSVGTSCQSTLPAPAELKAENSAGLVKLTWMDTADNENGFYVERSQEVSTTVGDTVTTRYTPFDQIADMRGENIRLSADDKIQAGTSYQYRVRAYNTCGFSGYSNVSTIKTPPGTSMVSVAPAVAPVAPVAQIKPIAPPPTPIETPKEVSVEKTPVSAAEQKPPTPAEVPKQIAPIPNVSSIRSTSTINSITFQWQNPSIADFASVQIQRSAVSFSQSITDGQTVFKGGAQSFIDSGLAAGQVYYYTFFTLSRSGNLSTGSFLAVTVKELPRVPVEQPILPAPVVTPSGVELPSIPSTPPVTSSSASAPTQEIAPSGILPAAPVASGSYSSPVSISGAPIPPAVTVSLPTEESKVTVKADEQQRTSAVMQDSSGGSSAFTVDIPANTFSEEAEVAITPITAAQTAIIDENARTPAGFESVGNVVYKIHVKNNKGERVKKFEKPVKLTFRYNDSLVQTINEDSLKAYYWESSLNSWIPLKSTIDTSTNVIIAEVEHATLFSIFGQQRKDITSQQRQKLLVASQSTTVYKRPESYLFLTDDLHLTSFDQMRSGWNTLASVGQTFYAIASSVLDICIPEVFFDKNTDTVTLSVSDPLRSDQYFLAKDPTRQCYATSFVAPKDQGVFRLAIKSINDDDSVRTNVFSLMTASWHEVLIVPPILRLGEYAGTPRIAGLIALLIIVIGFFVLSDVYQKVVRGKRKKNRN